MHERANKVLGKAAANVLFLLAKLSRGKTVDLIIDHELPGITPEMLDWWWLQMGDTQRYKLWHPKDHISARWEISPEDDLLHHTQLACEKLGGLPTLLRIRVKDPTEILESRTHDIAIGGGVLNNYDKPVVFVVHEYQSVPDGPLKMRSTFRVPALMPPPIRKSIRRHNRQEMAQFPIFLPKLYSESV
jgi:DAPG hydrolase PhiG domain